MWGYELRCLSQTGLAPSLRIPMWGYEQRRRLRWQESECRYESLCGVMSPFGFESYASLGWLRIPMWGYERKYEPISEWDDSVTNPYVGL